MKGQKYMPKVIVIGTDGSLGSLAHRRARDVFGAEQVAAGYYKNDNRIRRDFPEVHTQQVDIGDEESLEQALSDVECVISAVPQREPTLQRVAARLGVTSVDVGAHYPVAAEAISTVQSADSLQLVCAGQAPGITGLMASEVYKQTGEIVTVGFLLANRGRSGRAGVADMLGIIDQSSKSIVTFDFHGVGKRRAVPAERNEMSILTEGGVPMESVVAFESNAQNEAILALRKVGLLRFLYTNNWLLDRLAQSDKSPDDEAIYIGATSGDIRIDVRSKSDYLAAAYAGVAMAKLAMDRQLQGVGIPAQYFTLDEVLAEMDGVVTRLS